MKLKIVCEEGIEPPRYAHPGDAGLDLRSAVDAYLLPGESRLLSTGVRVEIPEGYVGLQFPRSGLGSKGYTMRNAVGVIDSGYRGEIRCALWNTTGSLFEIKKGDRICQLVIVPFAECEVKLVDELEESVRGEDGYGSTGVK